MSDKRTVTTDALETLGTIHVAPQKRDAIHLAVEPVVAGERLRPGDHVNVTNGEAYAVEPGEGLGIVDPFLRSGVKKGQSFWFVMYPRMVHSLRHVWTHPAFSDEPEIKVAAPFQEKPSADVEKGFARAKIEAAADDHGITFDDMIESARDFVKSGDYRVEGGRWEGMGVGDEFWNAYEIWTGEKVSESDRGGIFSCSC